MKLYLAVAVVDATTREVVIPDMGAYLGTGIDLADVGGSMSDYDRLGRRVGVLHFLPNADKTAAVFARSGPESEIFESPGLRGTDAAGMTLSQRIAPGRSGRERLRTRAGRLIEVVMTVRDLEVQ